MHFVDAKGILTGSGGRCGMNIYEDASKSVKIEWAKIGVNTSSRIACVVPQLESGSYKIKLVTQYARNSVPRKEPQASTFGTVFAVLQ